MDFSSFISRINEHVFSVPSTSLLFNQYRDIFPDVDIERAHDIRQANLLGYLGAVAFSSKVLVVGEAAGPWGCRFSGVPFVGEGQYLNGEVPFSGKRSSKNSPDIKIKSEPPFISRSSRMFWQVMKRFYPRFLIWDCVPLHPHQENIPLSVRNPTTTEIKMFLPAMEVILRFINPIKVVSVGRVAERGLKEIGVANHYVRHPSRGGFTKFKEGMERVFSSI